jgi:hypothetical protein
MANLGGHPDSPQKRIFKNILREKGRGLKEANIHMNCRKGEEFFTASLCH